MADHEFMMLAMSITSAFCCLVPAVRNTILARAAGVMMVLLMIAHVMATPAIYLYAGAGLTMLASVAVAFEGWTGERGAINSHRAAGGVLMALAVVMHARMGHSASMQMSASGSAGRMGGADAANLGGMGTHSSPDSLVTIFGFFVLLFVLWTAVCMWSGRLRSGETRPESPFTRKVLLTEAVTMTAALLFMATPLA